MEVKTIQLFDKPLFNWIRITDPIKMPTPMPEDEAGFVYILNGSCTNFAETDTLKLTTNQAVLAKSGNSTFSTHEENGSTNYEAIVIKFHRDVIEKLYAHSISPLLTRTDHPLLVNSTMVQTNILLREYVKGLIKYFEHPELVNEDLLKAKLNELVLLLLQSGNTLEVLGIMNHLFETKKFAFKKIIQAHICSDLSLQDLAQLTGMSLSSFKKTFRETYNDTPQHYLISQRIKKVAQLLPNSQEPISAIAYDCAFQTLAHMSRVFKTTYGVSPSQYKKNFSDK